MTFKLPTRSARLLGATALLALSGLIHAQAPQGPQAPNGDEGPGRPGGHGPRHHGPPIIKALDTDRDHEISAAEITGSTASLKTLDQNGDGKLTGDEIRPGRPPHGPPEAGEEEDGDKPAKRDRGARSNQGGKDRPEKPGDRAQGGDHPKPPAPPIMDTLDGNDDGELSAEEIIDAPESLKKADKNGDGALSGDEIHPPRPPKHPEGERPERPERPEAGNGQGGQGGGRPGGPGGGRGPQGGPRGR